MAITNAMIIATAAQQLLEEGKLRPTGRILTFETTDGNVIKIPEAEPIHTFAMWKNLGYKVKKGEHAIAKLTIWKYAQNRREEEATEEEEQVATAIALGNSRSSSPHHRSNPSHPEIKQHNKHRKQIQRRSLDAVFYCVCCFLACRLLTFSSWPSGRSP